MTSAQFSTFSTASILIEDRQRKELTKIDELAESIARIGLINPIVITRDGVLVAGERRLTACKSLGWTSIPVQFTDDLSDYELQCIELEENVKRVDLSWQDQCLAIAKFHELKRANEPDWSQEKTSEAIGITQSHVARQLSVAKEIAKGNERVATADKFSVAHNIVQRNTERKKASVALAVDNTMEAVAPESAPEIAPPPIINADFHEWQAGYSGPRFNLLHCDFPYGINVADSPRQNSSIKDHYEDSPDVYFALLETLASAMENVVAESAHLIFWFSMDYFTPTKDRLTAMGWNVNPFPLVWHKSDNAGIAPDPQRGPRRTYEAAFFCSRGDRKLTQVGAGANSFAFPGNRAGAIHISEKPRPVLHHFLRMICDEYSTVLDPTAGSCNALKVAEELGASRVLGIERSQEFFDIAVGNWSSPREGERISI